LGLFGFLVLFYDDIIMTYFCRVAGMEDDVAADVLDDVVEGMKVRW